MVNRIMSGLIIALVVIGAGLLISRVGANDNAQVEQVVAAVVDIQGITFALTGVEGLHSANEVIVEQTADSAGILAIKKHPGDLSYSDIVLRRTYTGDTSFLDWRQLVIDGKIGESRRSGRVRLYKPGQAGIGAFCFENAFPASYVGPQVSLHTGGNPEEALLLAIEKLTPC